MLLDSIQFAQQHQRLNLSIIIFEMSAITQTFIQQLINHSIFELELKKKIIQYTQYPKINTQLQCQQSNNANTIQQLREISDTLIQITISKMQNNFQAVINSIKNQIATVKISIQQLQKTIVKSNKDQVEQHQDILGQCSINNLQNSSIEYNFLKRNIQELQQRINQINFGNSFSLDLLNKQDEQELSQRINKSVGDTVIKFQSSVETRISRVEKDLNRRVDHIQKTMRSLFDMINQIDLSAHQKTKKPVTVSKLGNLFGFGQ